VSEYVYVSEYVSESESKYEYKSVYKSKYESGSVRDRTAPESYNKSRIPLCQSPRDRFLELMLARYMSASKRCVQSKHV
jgi:hypothetical protein